ncbi:hypothetical protein L2E82_38163 [Cichorium intybus]|uniref:Uncharacterized protein n=1 Tax=Cichorium intybus TaxID=13427 RepID=A0ACB9AGV0_CICIN|nr:hypothetical protein L2E82_38163 [Cichorium intybus]
MYLACNSISNYIKYKLRPKNICKNRILVCHLKLSLQTHNTNKTRNPVVRISNELQIIVLSLDSCGGTASQTSPTLVS